MSEFKDIEVTQSVLENNNRQAEELRKELKLYRFSNITIRWHFSGTCLQPRRSRGGCSRRCSVPQK